MSSIERGPSEMYLKLLKGEITSKDYLKQVKKPVSGGAVNTSAKKTSTQRKRGK